MLAKGEALCGPVHFFVSGSILREELTVGGFEVPVVDGVEVKRVRNIAKELCASVMRVLLEQVGPLSGRTVDCFKHSFTSRLDFELPEDYKHRCPIFCSRYVAIQEHFKGEGWPAERL